MVSEAFLYKAWYVAAWPSEVTRTPLRRVFLEQPVMLYRREDGRPVALADSCPHRFVPLSRGSLVGDEIVCCYHGLRFNPDGACTLNPHGDGTIPAVAKVRAYPLAESQGLIWIWMGAAADADPRTIPVLSIPHFPALDDADAYAAVGGRLSIAANYELITDNLLDLSHVQFLHPGLRVANPRVTRHEMKQEGNAITSYFWRDEGQVNGLLKLMGWPADRPVDSRAHMHWQPPALMTLDVGVTDVGRPVEEGMSAPSLHLLTPESRERTHYFFAFLRTVGKDDAALTEKVRVLGLQAFEQEDKPVIEAQQMNLGEAEIMSLGPALLAPDAAGVRARRVLRGLIEAQRVEAGSV